MEAIRKLVAGNWKMHGTSADLGKIEAIAAASRNYPSIDVALCVPAILIERAARLVPGFAIGAQDVHHAQSGAHTGSVSAQMLLDAGARLTIVGHSERRDSQRESNREVKVKAETALSCGLGVILCVGETLKVRDDGEAITTVLEQLKHSLPTDLSAPSDLAIAYEPIWAIGTGKIPTKIDIGEMHSAIRVALLEHFGDKGRFLRILYGGSVKASNAKEIFLIENVEGALVGGASLRPEDFIPIVTEAAGALD